MPIPNRLKVWDAQSGSFLSCPLTDIPLPYTVRSISWNNTQHMIAVAMAGQGASVAIYTAEKESVLRALERAQQSAVSDYFNQIAANKNGESEIGSEDGGAALSSTQGLISR